MKTLTDRFWSKVTKSDGCWEWTDAPRSRRHGYGGLKVQGKTMCSHILSWNIAYGPVPEGMCVLHRCDNRKCVRPDHLFLGTRGDNNTDRHKKNRDALGERNGASKLTSASVMEIVKRFNGGENAKSIALAHGISFMSVYNIVNGVRWGHVTGIRPK